MPPAAPAKPACPRRPRAQRYADPPLGRQLPPASAGLPPRQKPLTIGGESPFRGEGRKACNRRVSPSAIGQKKACECSLTAVEQVGGRHAQKAANMSGHIALVRKPGR